MADEFKITIHMVASLDGFVANKENTVSWFETQDIYEKGVSVSPEESAEFLKKIDCYVMGSRTYEHALGLSKNYGWAYGDTPTIVVTSRELQVERDNIETYSGDLITLVNDRLKPKFRNVWLVGGPALANEFIRLKLADEISLSILPIILGEGSPFFEQKEHGQALHLMDVKAYKSGLVELRYEIKR